MKKIIIDLSQTPEFSLTLKVGREVLASMVSDEFGQWLKVAREHLETCSIKTKIKHAKQIVAARCRAKQRFVSMAGDGVAVVRCCRKSKHNGKHRCSKKDLAARDPR